MIFSKTDFFLFCSSKCPLRAVKNASFLGISKYDRPLWNIHTLTVFGLLLNFFFWICWITMFWNELPRTILNIEQLFYLKIYFLLHIFIKIYFLMLLQKGYQKMWGVYCKCKVGSRAESSLLQALIYKSFQCIEIHQMSIQGQPMPFIWIYFFAGLQK